jgi:hypothetical protein
MDLIPSPAGAAAPEMSKLVLYSKATRGGHETSTSRRYATSWPVRTALRRRKLIAW